MIIMIPFLTVKLRKNICFEPIGSLISFLTAQTKKSAQTKKNLCKKIVKQIGEIIG